MRAAALAIFALGLFVCVLGMAINAAARNWSALCWSLTATVYCFGNGLALMRATR